MGWARSLGGAAQEPLPHLVFEGGDRAGHGRLRDVQLRRGFGEGPKVCRGDEHGELTERWIHNQSVWQ